jgi:biopolymer transport protein ExbD
MRKINAYTNPIFDRPQIQMIPLIDIMFFALIFFMILSVYYHVESQMDISIPASSQSHLSDMTKKEMIINVNTHGDYIVNGQTLSETELDSLLHKTASSQTVVIRADKKTYHQDIIKVLDICARNNIQDISFATQANPT